MAVKQDLFGSWILTFFRILNNDLALKLVDIKCFHLLGCLITLHGKGKTKLSKEQSSNWMPQFQMTPVPTAATLGLIMQVRD